MKRFTVHFRHRQTVGKVLEDVFEETLAESKADAVRWGKSIAQERGWWFMSAENGGAKKRTHAIQTSKSFDGQFYASIARLFPHQYGQHTAYGRRVKLKPGAWRSLGRYPDRRSALAAGRLAIQGLGAKTAAS